MPQNATPKTDCVTGDSAFAVDRRGVIVHWNAAAEKLFGFTADAALGQRCWELLAGLDVFGNRYCCAHCPLLDMAAHHESVRGFELRFQTSSEGRKELSVSCLAIFETPESGLLYHICREPEKGAPTAEHRHVVNSHMQRIHNGHLTERELEVLALLADGKSTCEIASTMFISEATVRNHIQHILHKLRVHNRLEAVVMGRRIDLI
ncbi:MAG: LuxR C-terminal-related transcriptional regulator [Xanthomonadales bacterium]